MDWREFRQVASALAQTKSEAFLRSAISRAYYAAYNVAVEGVALRGCKLPAKGNTHETVREFYRLNGATTIYTKLGKLRQLRNISDYRKVFKVTAIDPISGAKRSRVIGLDEIEVNTRRVLLDSQSVIELSEKAASGKPYKNLVRHVDDLGKKTWRLHRG